MTPQSLLHRIGTFTPQEEQVFAQVLHTRTLAPNDTLLRQGETCTSLWCIVSGCGVQYRADTVVDLHVPGQWVYNHTSLINGTPSETTITAFAATQVYELTLANLHYLLSLSGAFTQLAALLNQTDHRTHLYDHALTPAQKYRSVLEAKPSVEQLFPGKLLASYLKITPETLSRVRAAARIS